MALIPLANPKGVKLLCELCSKPAYIVCTDCRVTFYCDAEHQEIDRIGIHEKICQHLISLRTPAPFISGFQDEREYQKQQQISRQKQLIKVTRTAGQKLLFEGQYEFAIPAAMQSLKFAIDVYGLASIELVPSYLILGEACIGLGRLSQAEEYLAQAQWTVLKTPECENEIRSRLHRNLGMLHSSQENVEKALVHFSDDIYYASCAFGTDHIRTCGGYFHMANVFHQQNKFEVAYSLYNQLVEIWTTQLKLMVDEMSRVPKPPKGIGPAQYVVEEKDIEMLDEAQGAEAVLILHAILAQREQQSSTPASLSRIFYTLSMLYVVLGDFEKARDFSEKAMTSAKKGLTVDESQINTITELNTAMDRIQTITTS